MNGNNQKIGKALYELLVIFQEIDNEVVADNYIYDDLISSLDLKIKNIDK